MLYTGVELSQAELIKRAFAGDDVLADFQAEKAAEVAEELPKEVCIACLPSLQHAAVPFITPCLTEASQAKELLLEAPNKQAGMLGDNSCSG